MESFLAVVNNMSTPKRVREEDKSLETINHSRPLSKTMLLPTTYGLNASCSKSVTIGLELVNGKNFEVVIKFSNRYSDGISLSVAEWQELSKQRSTIEHWFNNQEASINDSTPTTQSLGRQSLSFTTSYNERAIILALKGPSDHGALKKAKKAFSLDIVMQKTTYQGLLRLTPCINTRMELLSEDLSIAQEIADKLIELISLKITKRNSPTGPRPRRDDEYTRSVIAAYDIPLFCSETMDRHVGQKRCLIVTELICIHHEFIFRKVTERAEELRL